MAYEILFAQISSILFGSTVLQYAATIGLYLFALGLGSIIYVKQNIKGSIKIFIWVELALSFFGALSPLAILLVAGLLPTTLSSGLAPVMICSFVLILVVGILTGIELPCLMDLAAETSGNTSSNKIQVLSWDLVGTFLGGPLVLFLLYPIFGIVSAATILGTLNVFIALLLLPHLDKKITPAITTAFLLLLTGSSIYWNDSITLWITELTF